MTPVGGTKDLYAHGGKRLADIVCGLKFLIAQFSMLMQPAAVHHSSFGQRLCLLMNG